MKATHTISQPVRIGKEGEEKTYWNRIGRIFISEKDGKMRKVIKMDNIPVNWDGWAYLFPIENDKNAIEEAKGVDNSLMNNGDEIDLSEIPF